MAAKESVLGFIYTSREIGSSSLIWMQFLDERPVSAPDRLCARPALKAKDLISLLLSHFATAARPRAATGMMLRMLTPAGLPTIKIGGQQIATVVVDFTQ